MDLASFAVYGVIALAFVGAGFLYFAKKMADKVDSGFSQISTLMIRMDMQEKQTSVISRMAEDVAVLKYAIIKEIGLEQGLGSDRKKRNRESDDDV